jgi:hypothetical protein
MIHAREGADGDEDDPAADIDADAKRWVVALTLTGLLMTLLVIAGVYVATTARGVNRVCVEKKANDEPTLMDAFFQAAQEQEGREELQRRCAK